MHHILSCDDITKDFIKRLFPVAKRNQDSNARSLGHDFIMASFFGEPSTRTRLSFETAAHRLNGKVITAADASASSSIKKGETLKDTIITLGNYADVIVMRHSDPNWINIAREYSTVPVISGGNGSDQHPTQALLDMFVVWKNLQIDPAIYDWESLENKKWLLCGDLKHSRTIHSLVPLLKMFNSEIFAAPDILHVDNRVEAFHLDDNDCEVVNPNDLLDQVDVVYMTRSQKERHSGIHTNEKRFVLTGELASQMKESALILHPLPRGNELPVEVDTNKRSMYLKDQMRGGVFVRQALLQLTIQEE
jgi:aspartate carbamoyltransferase catalytic subunit